MTVPSTEQERAAAMLLLPPEHRDEWAAAYWDSGYGWCRPCGRWHRPPECAVDQEGRALASCGCPWERIEADPQDHLPGCCHTPGVEFG